MGREDINSILNDGIDAAAMFLRKRGEFYPFAVVMTTQGEIRHIQTLGEDNHPDAENVRISLKRSLRETDGTHAYKTIAVISDVKLTNEEDEVDNAIRVEIDDKDDDPVLCYVPYKLKNGSLTLGSLIAGLGNRIVFF